MAVRRVQLRRGTTAQNNAFRGVEGEITVDTETKSIRVHDGDNDAGFDLMRADMSNNTGIATDINFTDANRQIGSAMNGKTLTLGQANTTISIPGTLNVNVQNTTADLIVQERTIVLASGTSTNDHEEGDGDILSVGFIFTRPKAALPGEAAQNPAVFYWDENSDRFRLGTGNITTATDEWNDALTNGDITIGTLYATTGVDVNNANITNVGQVELDTITFADADTVLTINLQDALNDKALTLKDGGGTEYLTINTNAESTTIGAVAKTTTIRSNTITLGTDADNDIAISVAERTGNEVGRKLTIAAGSSDAGGNDNNGGDLVLKSGGGDGDGTSDIEFWTKPADTSDTATLKMTLKGSGRLGMGTATPSSLLHIAGDDTSTITLENTKDDTFGQDDDPSTIVFKGNGQANALAEIVGAHDTAVDNDKGVLIFKTGDGGTTEALRLASDNKATFAGAVEIATSLDLTDGNISNVGTIDLDKISDRANNGIEIEIQNGQPAGLVIDDTDGNNFLTLNADADTITLHQATSLSSTLQVDGGSATIQGAEDASAILYLNADESTEAGDNWRLQAKDHATRTLTFEAESDAANTYVDVLTLTGANTASTSSATVKGTLIVEGEIQSATDIVFQVDNNDNGVNNKFAFQSGDNTEVASLDEAGKLTITGVSDLDGGIDVNASKFTVATTGAIDTQSTLQVDGNVRIGENGLAGSPTLTIVEHTGGATKFSVAGVSGATTIEGETTFGNTLNIKQGVANGIVFNSDRDAENDQDAALIKVLDDSDDGNDGYLKWDDGLGSFSFSGSKLNSVLDITVGALGSATTTISASTGAIDTAGSAPNLTLKQTTAGHGAGQPQNSQISFQDHDAKNLAVVKATHEGTEDDYKGQLLFYTNDGNDNDIGQLALTISSAQLATFAGNATVSGGTINVGGSGANISASGADTLTLTETTVETSAALTVGSDITVNGNIVADQSEAKTIFSNVTNAQITIGSGTAGQTDTVLVRQLVVADNINVSGAGALTIGADVGAFALTLGGATSTVVTAGDLTVQGGTNTAVLTLGQNQGQTSEITVAERENAHGNDLTISAGSTNQGVNDLNGGDLILKSGSGDGNGTSEIQFWTLTTNGETTTQKMTLASTGNLGIGEASPDSILHITDTAPSIKVLNTTHGDGNGARSSNVAFFGEKSGGGEGQLAQITASHDGTGDDWKGKFVFGVNDNSDANDTIVDVLTLASDKSAKFEGATTFEGAVTIKGSLDIQATGTLTTIDTTNLSVSDAVIELASNADQAVADSDVDTGIVFTRGSDVHPAVFYWDEEDTKFVLATKDGASTSTTNFSAGNAPAEAQLDVGTLNADIIEMDTGDATSLVFNEAGGDTYLTFNTDADKIVFGKIFEATTSSKIGDLTLGNGSITSTNGGGINFNTTALTTSGACDLGATTVDSLNASSGGITGAGAISGATTLATITGITLGAAAQIIMPNDSATGLRIMGDVGAGDVGDHAYMTFVTTNEAEAVVVNEEGEDIDFRVEGDGATHLIFAKASNDRVGIKNDTPLFDLDITGTLGVSGLADLNGGIDVNGSNFKVDADGVVTSVGTLNLKDASGGIVFNSDRTGNLQDTDAPMLTVERGNNGGGVALTNAILAWDQDVAEFNFNSDIHSQGVITVGGATSGAKTITLATGGAITATTAASAFASATTIGNVTYSTDEIAGADASNLTLKSDQDLIFNIDFDANGGAGAHKFSFQHNVGVEVAQLTDQGNLTLGVDDAADNLTIAGITNTNNAGVNLTIKAGSGPTGGGANLNGGNLILSTGDGDGTGTASMVFMTKVEGDGTAPYDAAAERMRFHTNGYLGIGDNEPETIVHIKGSTTATSTLTIESSANGDQNAQDEGATILAFKGDENLAFSQVVGAHDGTGNDDKGVLIFKTNNNTALTEALRIDSSQKATFSGDVTIKNDADSAHAVLSLISDRGDNNGDTWTIDADDENATLTINNNVSGGSVAQLTLVGDATAVDGVATFAGDVTTNGDVLTINSATLTSDGTDFETSGDLTVAGGVFTVVAPDATASEIQLQASLGTANGDSWKLSVADEDSRTLTFSGQNTTNANYQSVLVLKADNTLADSLATFGGKVKINGVGQAALDFTNANTTIGHSIGDAILTLGAAASTISIPGDLKIGTTKSITLNSGAAGANADIIVDRDGENNGVIRWVEATERFEVDNATNGTFYHLLHENDTLLTVTTDTGGGSAHSTTQATPGISILGQSNEIDVTNANGVVTVGIKTDPTLTGDVTISGNIIGNGNHILFKDRMIFLGKGNDDATRDLGWFAQYSDRQDNTDEHYAGLIYQPVDADGGKDGVYKLFHGYNTIDLSTGTTHNITVADSELATVDVGEVRGGSALGADDTAGANLTISGGASTGNGAGGSILFKVAEASQGAGGTERLPTTTALTVNASKRVITAGDLEVQGQAVLDDSTIVITAGAGAQNLAVTKSFHKVTPDAANNSITLITGGETGSILVLMHSGNGGTLTLTNNGTTGTANALALDGGDIVLANNSTATLIHNGNNWSLISKMINS